MCPASQRGSRCWRKTLARYGEAGPKRALCRGRHKNARLFRVQTLSWLLVLLTLIPVLWIIRGAILIWAGWTIVEMVRLGRASINARR
jgi:hypothetical protein